MIEKVFRCDLCGGKCGVDSFARRLSWTGSYIRALVLLDDNSASEKIICGQCLSGLRAALEIKDLTWPKEEPSR